MPTRIPVILNATAGSGRAEQIADELAALFLAGGVEADVRSVASGEEMEARLSELLADEPALLVAGGGDGTISAVAAAVVGTTTKLGVLPLGTLNHFAKDLGIPLGLGEAVQTILGGVEIRVDAGDVNGHIFINNSSIGLYPDLVRDRERQQRRLGRGKWWSFWWATIAALRRSSFVSVTLQLNGTELRRRSPFVFVGNNEYRMDGLRIGERERLDRGALSIYVMRHQGRAALVRLALRALAGRLKETRDFDAMLAHELVIETRHARMLVATDGEVTAMATPLRYRIRRACLRVIVPAGMAPEET
jgi:diacylglycerol kinase family enzyme